MAENVVHVDLVTPEQQFASVDASLVEVPGAMGDFGVLPGHSPLISAIRPGVLTIHTGATKQRYVALGGIAEVTTERCTILAEYLEDVSSLSRDDADKRLSTARKAGQDAVTDEEKRGAERELRIAEALAQGLAA
jgi:F-type H+-transporting ATPase subunit epsilon